MPEPQTSPKAPGDWPAPRQNRQLTALQPLPGRMKTPPHPAARIEFPRSPGALHPLSLSAGAPADHVLAIADGGLRCYRADGATRWTLHPAGLNFQSLVAAEDLDGDGRVELALMAGRPTAPLGAAVLVDAASGRIRFRYEVEPMSYWWTLQVEALLPGAVGKQLIVCEHGYPPDKKFGYLVLFAFDKPGAPPRQRWRFDFDAYTCFPTLLTADVDGDGVEELCAETHSRMWVFDVRTGRPLQFLGWDVAPANVRSYGMVRFQDLNGDGLPDFFCIANFSQHHEVLLNEKGKLARAWAHGWDDSVTTNKIATVYPDPPIADIDGDGRLEMALSMFQSETEPRWMVRIYDVLTGALKARALDRVAVALTDLDGDGVAEIVAEVCTDPTRSATRGASVLKWRDGTLAESWRDEAAKAIAPPIPGRKKPTYRGEMIRDAHAALPNAVFVRRDERVQRLRAENGQIVLTAETPPAPPPPPDFSKIPATVGPPLRPPLVADIDGDGRNEVIHFHEGLVRIYRFDGKGFVRQAEMPSSGEPALADFDGDGRLEMALGTLSPTGPPTIRAVRPGAGTLWERTLPSPRKPGMPFGSPHPLYFQTGRFLGRRGDDLYVFASTPNVRSVVLDGGRGTMAWEAEETSQIERYFAPTANFAAVWDYDGDGRDDLVFTNPDYYCVASGPTGAPLIGPLFPPQIFRQPSQGLYTLPALLAAPQGDPDVCLCAGHYFVAAMTLRARPHWYRLPEAGEARAAAEGFLRRRDGTWLLGYGRQDGRFACIEVATGKTLWQFPIDASASDVIACDIDGDGHPEFLFGTSHGELIALGDRDGKPRLLWRLRLGAGVGTPVAADVDGDGASELIVPLAEGALCLLRPADR